MRTVKSKEELSIEMKLFLICSINDFSVSEHKEAIKLVEKGIDWKAFYACVMKHRNYPVIYKNLIRLELVTIDSSIIQKLELKTRKNQLKEMQHTRELIRVMGLFEQNNIRAISIKGPCLSLYIYQDVSLRVSKDLDILIDVADIDLATKVLNELGYKEKKLLCLTPKQKKYFLKEYHHLVYSNNEGVIIELHWRLSDDSYNCISFNEAWQFKKEELLFGKKIYLLSEEENLIYLIHHGSVHAWKRLKWLVDIYEIIYNHNLDWDYIIRRAKELKTLYQIKQVEILMEYFFGVQLPVEIKLSKRENMVAKRLAYIAIPIIISLEEKPDSLGQDLFFDSKKYGLLWNISLRRKVLYLIDIFKPSSIDFEKNKLNDSCFFMYYFLRIYRLTISRLIKRNKKATDKAV